MPFPSRAWADPNHESNTIRPRVRCLGCGKKGCVTYWGDWCLECNIERMDRLDRAFNEIEAGASEEGMGITVKDPHDAY